MRYFDNLPKKIRRKSIPTNQMFPFSRSPRGLEWNMRLVNLVGGSLPINHSNRETSNEAMKAVSQATADIAPADPAEGMLIAQLMAANEASLALYRRTWQNVPEYFDAGAKFLQLADKAARTVVLLTERLDHHRGRGQHQITVTLPAAQASHCDLLISHANDTATALGDTVNLVSRLQTLAEPGEILACNLMDTLRGRGD
jgi:hypothetical protein